MVTVVTRFPDIEIAIESSESLAFTDADEIPTGSGANTFVNDIVAKTSEQREKFCKGRPWWDCSDAVTLGECAFVEGECKGAPIESKPERYFEKWKRLYTPVYANIPLPEMDEAGKLLSSKVRLVPRRKKSIRRNRASSIVV